MIKVILVYFTAIIYAVIRYVVFQPQNIEHLPAFVINKGISMAAAICFMTAFWSKLKSREVGESVVAAGWFRSGVFGVFVHVPVSAVILKPGYFEEFYLAERLSVWGEVVVLFGALTVSGIYLLGRNQWSNQQRWWASLVTMGALTAHTLSMGIARGMNISASHAYLPPMWLLSLIGAMLACVFLLMSYPKSQLDKVT